MENKFYVYKWSYIDNNKVFYIGKGCGDRYKNVTQRNQLFKEIYNSNPNNCQVEIIKYFDDEQEAFKYEEEVINQYKSIGEAEANIFKGGTGGYKSLWTPEMRQYLSKFNPMYKKENRMASHLNPPMHNPEVVEKVRRAIGHSIVIDNVTYISVYEAARKLGKAPGTIFLWGKRGTSDSGNKCYYVDKELDNTQKQLYSNNSRHNAKPVIIDGILYSSIKEGAEAINGRVECLSRALLEGRKYKGHTCNYANQQPSQENN